MAKENAKKCAALSEVGFFLLLRPVAYFIFSLSSSLSCLIELACSVTTQNILDMRPFGRKKQRFDGKRANTQYAVSPYPDSYGLRLSSIIGRRYRVFTLT